MSGTFALVWCLAAGAIVTFCVIRRMENLESNNNIIISRIAGMQTQIDDLKRELEERKEK